MANIRFTLRSKKNSNSQTIYLVYNFGSNDKLMYPTGFKIEHKYWNYKKHRVADKIQAKNKNEINHFLNELTTVTQNFILENKIKRNKLSKNDLRKFLDIYLKKIEPEKELTLFVFIDKFIEQGENRINHKTGRNISKGTLKVYNNAKNHLLDFQEDTKRDITFENIDYEFYLDFVKYLQSKMLSTNTIAKLIKTLKTFLNDAIARNIDVNMSFKSARFKIVKEASTSIYLTEKELEKMYKLDLSDNLRLDRIRDFFILACWTGARYSDISKLTYDNIRDESETKIKDISKINIHKTFLKFEQTKTKKEVVVPLHPTVLEIFKKYKGKMPNVITNQKFNDYIKEIGKLAEINEPTTKGITKGGLRVETRHPKYELISSHCARRSFATNLYNDGLSPITIMQATGHKSEKSFITYLKSTPTEQAKLMQLHWQKKGKYMNKA